MAGLGAVRRFPAKTTTKFSRTVSPLFNDVSNGQNCSFRGPVTPPPTLDAPVGRYNGDAAKSLERKGVQQEYAVSPSPAWFRSSWEHN